MAYRKRTDANHAAIMRHLRTLGCSVKDVSMVPGFVDLVVGTGRVTELVEIKDGSKPPSAQKLTPAEERFWLTWAGRTPHVVRDLAQASRLVELMREESRRQR